MPSELFTNTVFTPACCARATIAGMLPPSDLLTYQIHMPVLSNAVPLPRMLLGVGLRIEIGPTTFERAPPLAMILIRPDCAVTGTVTTKPAGRRTRSFAVSAEGAPPLLAARALRRNSTSMPFFRLRPRKRRRPPGATTC